MAEISKEEFAQYDRQIRLWGLDAQKRLRAAKVLVIGIGGLGSEIVKNIVLAGVHTMTLMDHRTVHLEDLSSQLLITPDTVGKNIASASLPRTKELNPNVIVSAVEHKPEEDIKFLMNFDVVCLTRTNSAEKVLVSNFCHDNAIKFICGDVFGFYGYGFFDLGKHDFVMDVESNENGNKSDKGSPNETITVKKTVEFCSYEHALKEDWKQRSRRDLKLSSPAFFVMLVIDAFVNEYSRLPVHNLDDYKTLLTLKNNLLSQHGVANVMGKYFNEEFAQSCISVLNPVAAIVGGVLGQEIIKAISQKDPPHNNFFCFDGVNHSGIVDLICPKAKAENKSKSSENTVTMSFATVEL